MKQASSVTKQIEVFKKTLQYKAKQSEDLVLCLQSLIGYDVKKMCLGLIGTNLFNLFCLISGCMTGQQKRRIIHLYKSQTYWRSTNTSKLPHSIPAVGKNILTSDHQTSSVNIYLLMCMYLIMPLLRVKYDVILSVNVSIRQCRQNLNLQLLNRKVFYCRLQRSSKATSYQH